MEQHTLSIVVSAFNEAKCIGEFYDELQKVMRQCNDYCFEIIWVNDGSIDDTQLIINSIKNSESIEKTSHVSIEFSRNYGHEAAMIAGIDNASGDAIICMDADGQHPPECVSEMIEKFKHGTDIVLVNRKYHQSEGLSKKLFSSAFYKLLNIFSNFHFTENSTDFFLISKQVAQVLKDHFREQSRFLRGFIQTIGFKTETVVFTSKQRLEGKSRYSLTRLFKLGIDALFSLSNKPLRLTIVISTLFILFTIVFGTYSLYMFFFSDTAPSGYTSIVLFLSISFSILFTTIAILSLYFEKALNEIRNRPIYIIKNIHK